MRNPEGHGGGLDQSGAFREAALRSEERRAVAVIGVILMLAAPIAGISVVRGMDPTVRAVGALAGLVLLGVELTAMAVARSARRRGSAVPWLFGPVGVAVECSVPTAAVLAHIKIGVLAPYTALGSPPLLAYGLLIGLTTLRLRPGLCLWGGAVSAAGYVSLLVYVRYGLGVAPPAAGWPREGYLMAAFLVMASGAASAWVAREIRGHAGAALAEAESRRRAERLEQELSVAREIQRSLLPAGPPEVPGFDIAAWNSPADETGGDYYDWQRLPDGNWIVTLADVSGHGIGPALVTAACRAYVRASSAHHPDLSSLAVHVNGLLAEDLPAGRFVTMATVLIDGRGGAPALLSAGHGPIVLYIGATREVLGIDSHGLPLAVVREFEIGPPQRVGMEPGDVLALITDGVVEWSRPDGRGGREEFGVERLRASLARHAGLSAEGIIRGIAGDVAAFAGGEPQQDDLTIVILRRT